MNRRAFVIAFALVGSSVTTAAAEPQPDPLARNYVDLGVHGGALWRGSLTDARFNPIGYGFGATVDFGRAPFWGGAYVDVDFFGAASDAPSAITGRDRRAGSGCPPIRGAHGSRAAAA